MLFPLKTGTMSLFDVFFTSCQSFWLLSALTPQETLSESPPDNIHNAPSNRTTPRLRSRVSTQVIHAGLERVWRGHVEVG